MLNLVKGYKISAPEKLNEGYEVSSDISITANVNAEKILEYDLPEELKEWGIYLAETRME